MEIIGTQIEKHYHQPNLYNDIINRLKELDVDLNTVTRKDIAAVDEFHVRGVEVSRELAKIANINNARLLDIGCGIGGPCRMLADEFNCDTVGIDISKEYVATASKLSELVGLSHRTKFINGDALNLPFQNNEFDVVWTQHVQVNINDKLKFYSEIDRVLSRNGAFIYYEVFKNGNEEVNYPLPWADESKISFLEHSSKIDSILQQVGWVKKQSTNQTENGIKVLEKMHNRLSKRGVPRLWLNVLMGASTKDKIANLLNGLKEGKIYLESGIYNKKVVCKDI
ncbi:MAG: methyltransferase domain-containing protein [Bacteroidales bacterium]|nr:methyltransferase domain-containing protein [Bacteroidales bacterium]